jgi:hypothetical protein
LLYYVRDIELFKNYEYLDNGVLDVNKFST